MRVLEFVAGTRISDALGWTLIHFLWEGAIIAAALAALLLVIRSPRIRYVASCAALLALLASFAFTLIHFLPERRHSATTLSKIALPPWNPRPDISGLGTHFLDFADVIPWLTPLWIAGVCVFYLRYAAAWLSLLKMRRQGVCPAPDSWRHTVARLAVELKISRPVVLLESLLADTPVVLGHFRPVVLVPLSFLAGLPPDQVEAILLHEMAHIRRSDYLINVCQRLIEGLLFYHPAVWWVSRVIRVERENCCDDVVVALRGDAHRYAAALTALEQNRIEQQWPLHEPAVAATGGNLMKRVKRLLYPKGPSGIWAPVLATIVLLGSATMVLASWHGSPASSSVRQQGVETDWQKWLNEDAVYLISDHERAAFEGLTKDEERERFVEQFWARRDPTPGTLENEFKQEHYRRIAYANKHWQGQLPGWKMDRGRIYIQYGPPDEIESHPSGGNYRRPESEGGGLVMTYPFEDWRYDHFQGVGSLTVEFVDTASSGEFRMTLDPKEKYKKP